MGCTTDCWDLGPPPDSILFLPPPPAPLFLQPSLPDLLLNTTPCSSSQLCELWAPSNRLPEGSDYMEMPRKEVETRFVSNIDDTWLLVLVASSIGVLLLGALLAMFLLKCREMNMFGSNECSMHTRDHHRQMKNERECSSVNNITANKLVLPSESVLYHGTNTMPDNRMVWAALTPRGTQHFISENYPRDLIDDYSEQQHEDHYETIDNLSQRGSYSAYATPCQKDYEYEDPAPLIESYQLNSMMENPREISHYPMLLGGNTDMRCAATLRKGSTLVPPQPIRPRVSSPTRIEHPNLPPLNLHPLNNKANTLKRNTLGYRNSDAANLPKYGCQ